MDPKKFSVVIGYLAKVDRQSARAKKLRLPVRFSIAISSYRPSIGLMCFDLPMFLTILEDLAKLFTYDRIQITINQDRVEDFGSIESAAPFLLTECAATEDGYIDYDAFLSAEFTVRNEPVLYVEYEPYNAIGGPVPYHDSYNFAFYTKPEFFEKDRIIRCILEVGERNEYVLEHFWEGTLK